MTQWYYTLAGSWSFQSAVWIYQRSLGFIFLFTNLMAMIFISNGSNSILTNVIQILFTDWIRDDFKQPPAFTKIRTCRIERFFFVLILNGDSISCRTTSITSSISILWCKPLETPWCKPVWEFREILFFFSISAILAKFLRRYFASILFTKPGKCVTANSGIKRTCNIFFLKILMNNSMKWNKGMNFMLVFEKCNIFL